MKYLQWDITMDTSRKGRVYRATWREGKESITHYFSNFVGMIGYLGLVDFYSFRDYWNSQRRLFDVIKKVPQI